MTLGDSIRGGAKWLLAGNLAGQILQFAFGVVLARLLVPADFGLLVTVQIFTGLAGLLAAGGTGQALVRAEKAKLEDFQVVFTLQLVVGLLIYAGFFVTAPLFARWYNEPLYTALFRVSALSFLLRPFVHLPSIWLSREMRFKQSTIVNLICSTAGGILAIVLARQQFGIWSLVFGGMTASALSAVALMSLTPVRPKIRFSAALTKELGTYGIKVASNDLVAYVRSQTSNFILGRLQGPSLVGLFNKADSLAQRPRVVAHAAYEPVFRGLATVQDNMDRSRYIYFRTITLLMVYMAPLSIGLAWIAHPFIAFVYGPKWIACAGALGIMALAGPFTCIGYPAGAVLAARNWLGREIYVQLAATALFVASCLVGIRWGLVGVAWGILISEALSALFITALVARCLHSTLNQLAASVLPGILLNTLLVIALWIADLLLPARFPEVEPLAYMAVMIVSGALTYGLAFLFLPLPALAGESAKWKAKLGFIALNARSAQKP